MKLNYFWSDYSVSIDGVNFKAGQWTPAYETDEVVKRSMNGLLKAQKAVERIAVDLAPPIVVVSPQPLDPVGIRPSVVSVPVQVEAPVVVMPGLVEAPVEDVVVVVPPTVEVVLPVVTEVLPVVEVKVTKTNRARPQ